MQGEFSTDKQKHDTVTIAKWYKRLHRVQGNIRQDVRVAMRRIIQDRLAELHNAVEGIGEILDDMYQNQTLTYRTEVNVELKIYHDLDLDTIIDAIIPFIAELDKDSIIPLTFKPDKTIVYKLRDMVLNTIQSKECEDIFTTNN